jgi:hypothetical protein
VQRKNNKMSDKITSDAVSAAAFFHTAKCTSGFVVNGRPLWHKLNAPADRCLWPPSLAQLNTPGAINPLVRLVVRERAAKSNESAGAFSCAKENGRNNHWCIELCKRVRTWATQPLVHIERSDEPATKIVSTTPPPLPAHGGARK